MTRVRAHEALNMQFNLCRRSLNNGRLGCTGSLVDTKPMRRFQSPVGPGTFDVMQMYSRIGILFTKPIRIRNRGAALLACCRLSPGKDDGACRVVAL